MRFPLYLVILLTLFSCSPKEENYLTDFDWGKDSFLLADFVPIHTGNYWVYNTYMIDTLGKDSLLSVDSVSISGTKLIDGIEYFVLDETHGFGSAEPYSRLIRDSSGYLLYGNGEIGFSTVNFTDTLRILVEEGISRATYKMERTPEDITVPAGTFKCLNYKVHVKFDPFLNFWKHPDIYCNYYAPGIGKVKSTAFYVSKPYTLERRLVRFHIEPGE